MALPKVSITQVDGSLGIVPTVSTGLHVKIGAASTGNVGELTSFTSDLDAKNVYTSGRLLDSISVALAIAQGGPVYAMRMATSVAGTVSPVQTLLQTGSDGALATTGSAPLDDYLVIVKIVRAGKVGTSPYPTFTYSLDNGITTSDEIAVPSAGTYNIANTGLTIVFSNGATGFKVDDQFSFTTVGASSNNTDLSNALTALFALPIDFEFIHVVAPCDSTLATTVAAYLTAAESDVNNKRYLHGIVETIDMDYIAKLTTSGNAFPMTFAGGELLKIDISNDFGATFPVQKTFTFPAVTYANIAALVAALNVQSFTGGLFSVSASATANELQLSTFSDKGKVILKVNAASTAVPALIAYTLGQVAAGQTEDNWMNALIAAFATFSSPRVAVVAGHADIYSPISKRYMRRSGAWLFSAKEAAISVSTHPGQVDLGPLPLVLNRDISKGKYGIYHDEALKPGLDAARFTTLRSITNLPGFYVTRGRIMTTPGSDYQYTQYRRVIDLASKLTLVSATKFLNKDFDVNDADQPNPGAIVPSEAVPVEKNIQSYILSVMGQNITSATVIVDKISNFISTGIINISVAILPFGYAETINVKIGFAPVQPSK